MGARGRFMSRANSAPGRSLYNSDHTKVLGKVVVTRAKH